MMTYYIDVCLDLVRHPASFFTILWKMSCDHIEKELVCLTKRLWRKQTQC